MNLVLKNNVTKQEIVISGLTDIGTNALFYQFNIALPNTVDEGEYQYYLMDGTKQVATGLVQIGSFEPTKTTYNKENNGYVVYGK